MRIARYRFEQVRRSSGSFLAISTQGFSGSRETETEETPWIVRRRRRRNAHEHSRPWNRDKRRSYLCDHRPRGNLYVRVQLAWNFFAVCQSCSKSFVRRYSENRYFSPTPAKTAYLLIIPPADLNVESFVLDQGLLTILCFLMAEAASCLDSRSPAVGWHERVSYIRKHGRRRWWSVDWYLCGAWKLPVTLSATTVITAARNTTAPEWNAHGKRNRRTSDEGSPLGRFLLKREIHLVWSSVDRNRCGDRTLSSSIVIISSLKNRFLSVRLRHDAWRSRLTSLFAERQGIYLEFTLNFSLMLRINIFVHAWERKLSSLYLDHYLRHRNLSSFFENWPRSMSVSVSLENWYTTFTHEWHPLPLIHHLEHLEKEREENTFFRSKIHCM